MCLCLAAPGAVAQKGKTAFGVIHFTFVSMLTKQTFKKGIFRKDRARTSARFYYLQDLGATLIQGSPTLILVFPDVRKTTQPIKRFTARANCSYILRGKMNLCLAQSVYVTVCSQCKRGSASTSCNLQRHLLYLYFNIAATSLPHSFLIGCLQADTSTRVRRQPRYRNFKFSSLHLTPGY